MNRIQLEEIDAWLDDAVTHRYQEQSLAQDWARISKIGEELGEAIQCFIGATGQNPRKGYINDLDDVLEELCDVIITGYLAIQHFTKNREQTTQMVDDRLQEIYRRAGLDSPPAQGVESGS